MDRDLYAPTTAIAENVADGFQGDHRRDGDVFDPLVDQRFDLVLKNRAIEKRKEDG